MAQDSFILVNLKGSESKKLAQVISNDSSRKILDYLSDKKDATASSLAKELGIPLSTAHYNLKALLKARLIQVDEFHYSPKGKEVDHYKLSNRFVIIAPETTRMEGLREKLGKILPVTLVVAVGAGIVHYVNKVFSGTFGAASWSVEKVASVVPQVATDAVPEVAREIVLDVEEAVATSGVQKFDMLVPEAMEAGVNAAANVTAAAPEVVTKVVTEYVTVQPNYALWFLIGGLFAILVWLIWDLIRK